MAKTTKVVSPAETTNSWMESNKYLKRMRKIAQKFELYPSEWKKASDVLKCLGKSVFYGMVIFIGAFYTVQTSVVLMRDYATGKISSNLKTMFNKSITLPLSTVCLPIIPSELDEYQNLVKKALTHPGVANLTKHHYREAVLAYFNNVTGRTYESVLENTTVWPHSLLYVSQYYLASIDQLQKVSYGGYYNSTGLRSLMNDNDDLIAAIKVLEKRLKMLNIKTNELREKFGNDVSTLYGFTAIHTTDDGKKATSIQTKRVSYISLEQICYQFPFDEHPFKKEKDLITVKVNRASMPNARKNYASRTLEAFIDFRARDMVDASMDDNNDVFSSKLNDLWYVPIKISAVYRAMSVLKGNVQCSETATAESCTSDCESSRIKKVCNCTPLSTPLTASYDECDLSQLISCGKNLQSLDDFDEYVNCKSNCMENCERRIYELMDAKNFIYTSYNRMEIRLSVVNFDYPTFEETSAWTFSSFIGSLGGVLALWLGLDIVVTFSFVGGILKSCVGQKNSSSEISNNGSDANLRTEDEEINRHSFSNNFIAWSVWVTKRNVGSFAPTFIAFLRRPSVQNFQTAIRAIKGEKSMKWIAQKTMWALMVVLMGLLTGVLAFQTYKDYSRHPTVSNLKVMFDKPMSLPNGTLCLPLYLGELDDNDAPNVSYNRELSAFFKDENVIKEDILNYGQNWTDSFRHVVHAYLIQISKYEYLEGNLLQETDSDGHLLSAMRTLENNLGRLNVSVDELRQKFGNETAIFYSLFIREYGIDPEKYSNYREIDVGQTKFVGEEQICYQIRFDLILLTQYNDISIFFSEYSLPNPRIRGENRDWIIVDLLDRTHVDTTLIGMIDMVFAAVFGNFNQMEIESATLFQAIPEANDEARCSTGETDDECQAICRAQAIKELCDCAPTLSTERGLEQARNMNECSLDVYASCLNSSCQNLNVTDCLNECLPPCERWAFKMTYTTFGRGDSFTCIELSFHTLTYIKIEEQLKWSFESFLGEIGGIIGFLLGYNLYKIVYFLFTAFIMLSTFLVSRYTAFNRRVSIKSSESKNRNTSTTPRTLAEEGSSMEKERTSVDRRTLAKRKISTTDKKFSLNRISANGRASLATSINGRTRKEDRRPPNRHAPSSGRKAHKLAANEIISEKRGTKNKMWQVVNEVCYMLKIDREKSSATWSTAYAIRRIAITILKWTAIILFSYQTMVMGMSLVHEYKQGNTISVMKLYLNKSIALPISTVCMDFEPSELDEFNGVDASKLNGTEYQDQIKSYFGQKNLTKAKFLNEMNATTTLLYIVAKYMTALTTVEAGGRTDVITPSSTDSDLPDFFAGTGKDLYSARLMLEEEMNNLDISTNDVRQAFGRHIADMFSLNVAHVSTTDFQENPGIRERNIPLNQVTSISKTSICYQIRLDQYPILELQQDMIVITGRASNESLPHAMLNEDRFLKIDFSAGNDTGIELSTSKTKDVEFTFGTLGQAKVNIDSVYHSLPTISASCSEIRSMENCLSECRTEYIQKLCNCTPTCWSAYSSSPEYEECKLSNYTTCLNFSARDDENCTNSCVGSCNRWIFRSYLHYSRLDDGLRIEIQMIGFDYTLFEEQKKWTFERITGAIGGVLDFYLGLSFLKVTHLTVVTVGKLSQTIRWAMKTK